MVLLVGSQDKFLDSDFGYHFHPQVGFVVCRDFDVIQTKIGPMSITQTSDEADTSRYYAGYIDGRFVAYLTVANHEADDCVPPYWWIGFTATDRDRHIRGNGLTRSFIEWWVLRHQLPLMSDVGQTIEAQGVWKSMMMKNPILDFQLWHRDLEKFEPIDIRGSKPTPNPWNGSPNRIVALPR
jgi:hypothetical protein